MYLIESVFWRTEKMPPGKNASRKNCLLEKMPPGKNASQLFSDKEKMPVFYVFLSECVPTWPLLHIVDISLIKDY